MSTLSESLETTTTEDDAAVLKARQQDWSAYRERAIAAGKDFLGKVDGVLPDIAARQPESESEGRVSDATVQSMIGTGLFRAFTPLRYGGLEMDPASFFEGIMKIAEADASAAWVAGQLHVHSFEIALMSERMQDEFWADGPNTRASSSYAPIGKVSEADGGYTLNGTWTFSSGVDHAQWVILGGRDKAFVVPISDVSIDHSSWDVQGLKGTGSKSVTLVDVFVPEYRAHKFADTYNGRNPGRVVNNVPLYWVSFSALFNATPTNSVIGIGLGGINTFIEQSRLRLTRQGTGSPIAQNPFLHLKVAEALTNIGTIRDRHLNNWHSLFKTACRGEEASPQERMRIRYESAHANATCFESFTNVWPIAGAAASASDNPLQQTFRDLMAARNHGSAGRELAAGLYLKTLFGLPPAPFSDFGTLAYYK